MRSIGWIDRNCRFAQILAPEQAKQVEEQLLAPGESPAMIGTPEVNIIGDHPVDLNVGGHQIHIDLTISKVFEAIKSYLQQMQSAPLTEPDLASLAGKIADKLGSITTVVVGDFGEGEFGHASSATPHTVYINWDGMIRLIQNALDMQVGQLAAQMNVPPEEIIKADGVEDKVRIKVAEQLFEWAKKTIPHEMQHASDFQEILRQMILSGEGDLSQASEARAEQQEGTAGIATVPI